MSKTSVFKPPNFIVKLDPKEAGHYKVWIDRVFGFQPVQDVELHLPTASYPRKLTVKSSQVNELHQHVTGGVHTCRHMAIGQSGGWAGWWAGKQAGGQTGR